MSARIWTRGDGCNRCGAPVIYPRSHCVACIAVHDSKLEVEAFYRSMERLCAEVGTTFERPRFVRTDDGGWR